MRTSYILSLVTVVSALVPPHCTDTLVPITASGTNFNLSSGTRPDNATVPVAGTFRIQLRFCEPALHSRRDAIQVLVHGLTYNTEYWDPQSKEISNYVHFAAAQGFATLNVARLGYARSDHPDGVAVVQLPYDASVMASIIKLAREGGIPGTRGRSFRRVIYVGHSYGSRILSQLIATEPGVVDAAVFSGFGHTTFTNVTVVAALAPADNIDPTRFRSLPPTYVTSVNASTRQAAFYGAQGTFSTTALAFDEAHKDTATRGELLSSGASPAPDFSGDVLTINGDADIIFCAPTPVQNCGNLAQEGQFYPSARSVEFAVVPSSGHSLNFHHTAPIFFRAVHSWLTRRGY